MIWSFVLASLGILAIYLMGNKNKLGFLIAIMIQVLWVIFAITTMQYGFILSAFAYALVYFRGYYKWRKEEIDIKLQ